MPARQLAATDQISSMVIAGGLHQVMMTTMIILTMTMILTTTIGTTGIWQLRRELPADNMSGSARARDNGMDFKMILIKPCQDHPARTADQQDYPRWEPSLAKKVKAIHQRLQYPTT